VTRPSDETAGVEVPGTTSLVGKDNDTRYGLDIVGQNPESVETYMLQFSQGLAMIHEAHACLRLDADLYTAVWDRLQSWQRTALRKILTELPGRNCD
jgi:hypothetical protein